MFRQGRHLDMDNVAWRPAPSIPGPRRTSRAGVVTITARQAPTAKFHLAAFSRFRRNYLFGKFKVNSRILL